MRRHWNKIELKMIEQQKGVKELFANFFEDPDRIKFRDLLKNNTGEYNHIDFKSEWVMGDGLAKHILGFANSKGGVIVFGVAENDDKTLVSLGLNSLKDKTDIKKSVQTFIPEKLVWDIHNFEYNESEYNEIKGRKFQVLIVENTPDYIPFLSLREGDQIKKNEIYYRSVINTEKATHEQVQEIINRRIETGYSTTKEMEFKAHLVQLSDLYDAIPKYYSSFPGLISNAFFPFGSQKNPEYPEEDFQSFILKMIQKKKEIIAKLIVGK